MKKFMALSMAAVMAFYSGRMRLQAPQRPQPPAQQQQRTAANADTTAAESATEEETSGAASGKKYIINTDTTFAPL